MIARADETIALAAQMIARADETIALAAQTIARADETIARAAQTIARADETIAPERDPCWPDAGRTFENMGKVERKAERSGGGGVGGGGGEIVVKSPSKPHPFWTTSGIPPAAREPIWPCFLFGVPFLLMPVRRVFGFDVGAGLVLGAHFCVCAAVFFFTLRRKRGLKNALRKSGGLACAKCLYDLSDSPHEGRCPECGTLYAHDELRAQWRPYMPE